MCRKQACPGFFHMEKQRYLGVHAVAYLLSIWCRFAFNDGALQIQHLSCDMRDLSCELEVACLRHTKCVTCSRICYVRWGCSSRTYTLMLLFLKGREKLACDRLFVNTMCYKLPNQSCKPTHCIVVRCYFFLIRKRRIDAHQQWIQIMMHYRFHNTCELYL